MLKVEVDTSGWSRCSWTTVELKAEKWVRPEWGELQRADYIT